MKVTIVVSQNSDGYQCEKMDVDGKNTLYTNPLYECPEDAILERDLVSCQDIAKYMTLAYQAGKNGEDFVVVMEDE